MGVFGTFFAYARLVVVLVGRVVVKLLSMSAAPFVGLSRSVLGKPQVEAPDADKQLLRTENVEEAVHKDVVDEWVDVSDEDGWESGGRNMLDDNDKRVHRSLESSTEDELIELSDGEEIRSPISALYPAKRRSPPQSTTLTASTTTPLL